MPKQTTPPSASDLARALHYQRASELSGVASSLQREEASLKRRLGLYRDLGFAAEALRAAEERLLSVYSRQSIVLAQTRQAYGLAGRPDLAARVYGQEEETALRAAGLLQRSNRERTASALTGLSQRARTLEAYLGYAQHAGAPPADMASARAGLTSAFQQQAQLQLQSGDLAAFYLTQRELLRHRASPPTSPATQTSPWSDSLPSPPAAGASLPQTRGLLHAIIGGYGLQGPLYPPLELSRSRAQPLSQTRLRDKMTIVVELKPPGKSEEVLLQQWAALMAARLAHWLRTAV